MKVVRITRKLDSPVETRWYINSRGDYCRKLIHRDKQFKSRLKAKS